ncbi:MAG: ComEA family DNA-binding protein [Candidatus Omnitrophota bacterium]
MFSLTRQERQVILFLLAVSLVGMGIDFLFKVNSKVKTIVCANPDFTRVNLNAADKQELISIPGIGEKSAQRILDYRKVHGFFQNLEDLKNVPGFKGLRFEKIKESLYISQSP